MKLPIGYRIIETNLKQFGSANAKFEEFERARRRSKRLAAAIEVVAWVCLFVSSLISITFY